MIATLIVAVAGLFLSLSLSLSLWLCRRLYTISKRSVRRIHFYHYARRMPKTHTNKLQQLIGAAADNAAADDGGD